MKELAAFQTVKGIILMAPKGPADRKPEAKVLNKILQMDGETVAGELPAEHQFMVDACDEKVLYMPYLVYMPEKDMVLLSFIRLDKKNNLDQRTMLISSNDHGQTWSKPEYLPMFVAQEENVSVDGCHGLTYFGGGKLLLLSSNFLWLSHDYGETWGKPIPNPPPANGLLSPFGLWDPCLVDRSIKTGEVKRLIMAGYNGSNDDQQQMERAFENAEKLVSFPKKWRWRFDQGNKGLAEKWYKEKSFDNWTRSIRIDKYWTRQGEPLGVGWYATNFEMPDTGGASLLVFFGAVDGYCDLFIDGKKVGEQKESPSIMWETPFYLPLDQGLAPGSHAMVIRVEKDCFAAGIYKPIWIVDKSRLALPPRDRGKRSFPAGYCHSFVRFSYDGGLTWPEEIEPPSWNEASEVDVNEKALCRAGNGDIIAACRICHEEYMDKLDHYCGLGVSLSRDNGYTWTKVKILYDYGRHFPSMVLMPNGDIVMTYVVRMGCLQKEHRLVDEDGYPQWSIEAIVSRDNGENWDLSHRYILAKWSGMNHAQSTTTVLLPDGSLITAFGSGYLSQPVKVVPHLSPHEVGIVRWRPGE